MPTRTRHVVAAVSALGVVAAVVVATTAADHQRSVHLTVDGSTRTVSTGDDTVSAVLAGAGVRVGMDDTVVPSLASAVPASDVIVVRHARAVRLTLGVGTQTVWTTGQTVDAALTDLGLQHSGEYLSAPRSAPLGASLTVRLPQAVTVVHDGVSTPITTTAPTVAGLLAGAHLSLGSQDTLSAARTAYPATGTTVRITRNGTRLVSVDVPLAVSTTQVTDAALPAGASRTVRTGHAGVVHKIYAVTYRDGVEDGRSLVSRAVTTPMVPTVVHVGPRPAAPAAPAGPVAVGSSGGLDWAALAACESGGNPRSVGGGGRYFGLYQFSLGTWAGVGGSGNPIDASPAEQTARAELLYQRSGASSWPTCGRHL